MKAVFFITLAAAAAAGASAQQGLYNPGYLKYSPYLKLPEQESARENYWQVEENIELYYFTEGGGSPVLVLHGGPGSPMNAPWSALSRLSDRFTFYYFHQRGCGNSTRPVNRFSSPDFFTNMMELDRKLGIEPLLLDIERIRRLLKAEKITLIGHSYGGFLGVLYAMEFPEHTDKLVLLAPANMLVMPQETSSLFDTIQRMLPADDVPEYEQAIGEFFNYGSIFSKSEKDLQRINKAVFDFYIKAKLNAVEEHGGSDRLPDPTEPIAADMIGGWVMHSVNFSLGMNYDFRPLLSKITCPVLVVHGEKDLNPAAGSEQYADLLPNSEYRLIQAGDHFLYNTAPEETGRAIGTFLTGSGQKE